MRPAGCGRRAAAARGPVHVASDVLAQAAQDGALKELGKPRGRKLVDRRDAQIAALTRRAERAEAELAKMKRVVEIQGNVSALLEEMLGQGSAERSTER